MFKKIAITPESKDRLFVNYTALGCWSGNILHTLRAKRASEDDLRSRIFRTFVVKFLARLPLLGF